ncbi:MAG: NAD+ synthase [Nanoarchaeota archaeon]|nr:NAD+ synthase [Nanoarchaeota archaeon]
MKTEYYRLVEELRNFFKRVHQKKAVVGVSGGVDSAVVLKLCCDALNPKNVTALLMPEVGLTLQSNIDDGLSIARKLKVKAVQVPINPFLEAFSGLPWKQSKVALMNIKARIRALLLYNYANSNNTLVVGTSNKSEILLGYGTKYGDLACDVLPIGDLLKTQVYEVARFLEIPEVFLKKKPTAELTVGQTDEADLGASYTKLDAILRKVLLDEKLNKKDNLVKKTLQRMERNKHKRESAPIIELK